ncbi:MAG: L-2-hydroxyglutarate oxidase [Actinomycetes bacterium]
MTYDFCVIGGGIVGVATAMKLLEKRPGASLLLLEKEPQLSRHQTGHNSGVIHSGIYYAPGSLKAGLCRRGADETRLFCQVHGIPVTVTGKLLVATDSAEARRMDDLGRRAATNGIEVERISAEELRRLEPNIRGVGALRVPSTAIVDYAAVTEALAALVRKAGGEIRLGVEVDHIRETATDVSVTAGDQRWAARRLVACAGLQADRVARQAGLRPDFQIIPFRGEYFRLPPSKNDVVRHLIYPIPDPALPFLGVHLTRTVHGGVTVGPNAVLGFAREGYPRRSVKARDVAEYVRFPGMWKVARQHFRTGALEMRNSMWKRGYLEQCRKYCPSLTAADLLPEEAGIRAQAVLRDGTLVHDFLFAETPRMLHVCNAPSPAATSAMPIGDYIADKSLAS